MEESKFEILYDHYKETDLLRREAQHVRNKSFAIICIIETVSFLFIIKPDSTRSLVQSWLTDLWKVDLSIGNNVFQSLLWVLAAYFIFRYVQSTMYVERTYEYQGMIEKRLDVMAENDLFGREGEWYSKKYPNSLNLVDLFYKMLVPGLLTIIHCYRIIVEYSRFSIATIIDTIIFISITIIIWAFFFDIHPGISKWCREHVPGFSKVADWIRKELKKV